MLNRFSKFLLFYLAYLPLIISIIFKYYFSLYPAVGILLFSLIVVILTSLMIRAIRTVDSHKETVSIMELKNSEFLTFILTYLLPLFGVIEDIQTLISFLVIFVMIAFLYVETSLFCINPLLKILFGYNIYEIMIGDKKGYLLSKARLSYKDHDLEIRRLDYTIYMEDGKNE